MKNTKTKTAAVKKPVAKAAKKPAPAKRAAVSKKPAQKRIVAAPVAHTAAPASKMIGFGQAVRNFFARYFDFNGTSTRAEYWWVELFNLIVIGAGYAVLPSIFMWWLGAPLLALIFIYATILYTIAVAIPSLALASRRVHDAGFSAWVFFGPVIILVAMNFFALPGTDIVGFLVSVWGLALTLMPSKIQNNPYRD